MSDTLPQLQEVFCRVFGDDEIVLNRETTAADIDGWDSMMTINLMIAIEKRFQIRFAAAEIAGIKADGQNLGNLIDLIEKKTHRAS
jgi:acyl carrier protein